MHAVVQTDRNRFAKPLAFGLALLALVFFLQIGAHGHNDSRQDSACRVCQFAHVGLGPVVTAVMPTAPLLVVGYVTPRADKAVVDDSTSESSPRAPPSAKA